MICLNSNFLAKLKQWDISDDCKLANIKDRWDEKLSYIYFTFIMFSGLLPPEECSKSACTSNQDPIVNQCFVPDGYQRALLYRSWNTSCTPVAPDFYTTFTYPWEYHGSWHWGSTVALRCLPGYTLPPSATQV